MHSHPPRRFSNPVRPALRQKRLASAGVWPLERRSGGAAVDGMTAVCGLAGVYADENFPCGMSFGGAGGRRLWRRPRRGHILTPKYLFAFIAQRGALRNALEGGGRCVPSNRLPQPVTGVRLFLSVQGRPPNDVSRCHGVRQALVCTPPAGKGRAPSPSDVRCLLPVCIVRSRRAAQGGEAAYKQLPFLRL